MQNDLPELLSKHAHDIVFVRTFPSVLDFTDKQLSCGIEFFCKDGENFSVALSGANLPLIMSLLKITVLAEGRKLLCWDFKQLCSYVLAKTGVPLAVSCSLIDLKLLESYNGVRAESPQSFNEAMSRLRRLVQEGGYKLAEKIYRNVLLPLTTTVIPRLETVGILDKARDAKVYANYEIDGQENGRLRCSDAFLLGYVPHAMKPDFRANLRPIAYDEIFLSFDFRGMEVYTLAHVSGDSKLKNLCLNPDIYCAIYEAVVGEQCVDGSRELAKKMFLPVIYGQGPSSLARSCQIDHGKAEQIVRRIRSEFAEANEFVLSHERQLEGSGCVRDVFGKARRNFPEGKSYLARNFAVQSPASAICLEKLINLYFAINDKAHIAYTVHDGYVLYVDKGVWREVLARAHGVLTSECDLWPGLKLKVSCKAGSNLNELKPVRPKT